MEHDATILIIEDSRDDYEACLVALTQDNKVANPIVWCETGQDGLDYLHGRGKYADRTPNLPGLILLDLNMPGLDGRQVLDEIKGHNTLKRLPVVVMTTSSDQRDIDQCYEHGANSYVVKPVDLNGFLSAIARLRDYWFKIVVLPKI